MEMDRLAVSGNQPPPPPAQPVVRAPPATINAVCCHTVTNAEIIGAGIELVKQPCNGLYQNCAPQGCQKNKHGHTICDCTDNVTLWIMLISGVGAAVVGQRNTAKGEQPGIIGVFGYGWLCTALVYTLYRSYNNSAAQQVDPISCTALP